VKSQRLQRSRKNFERDHITSDTHQTLEIMARGAIRRDFCAERHGPCIDVSQRRKLNRKEANK
jgi:hypothetical protein